MKKQTIYLVRHGETDANLNSIYQGCRFNPPLNETGAAQILCLANFLVKEAPDVRTIYTSPFQRTLDSMAIIANALSQKGERGIDGRLLPRMLIERGLAEIDHGDWDGYTFKKVKKRWPAISKQWQDGNQNLVKFPNGESVRGARKRVKNALNRILENDLEKQIIIVAHGGVNALILSHILETTFFRSIRQSNACLNIIERQIENKKESFKIALMNSTAHLDSAQYNMLA